METVFKSSSCYSAHRSPTLRKLSAIDRHIPVILQVDFAIPKVGFSFPKVNFAISKVDFSSTKVNFVFLKVDFAFLQVDFANSQVNFLISKMAVRADLYTDFLYGYTFLKFNHHVAYKLHSRRIERTPGMAC
jgi:hypothetical protein